MAFSLIFFPALFTMFYVSREGKAQQIERTRAVSLATEAEEAIRSVREIGWNGFVTYQNGVMYHPEIINFVWSLGSGSETIDGFTRSVVFSEVHRDGDGAIVASGGMIDPSTRRATVTVSWVTPIPSSVTSVMYLTRHQNVIQTDTTAADFAAGNITDHVKIVSLLDGEVVLGSTGGYGDWCTPSLTITALDLPKSGVANAINAIQGSIAVGTGENASGVSYANVLISDPAFPTNPTASISGTFDGYKTNDVFTEDQYAYVATDTNNKEVEIISLTSTDANGKYSEAGYFNAPGNGNAEGVVTNGDIGYMVGGTNLYAFDLSVKTGSRPIVDADGVSLPGTGKKLAVVGSRAFVATSATNGQLAIVDVSNPSNLIVVNQIALPATGAKAIFVNSSGTRAYVVTGQSASLREFFIVNTEVGSPTFGQILSSYDTNGMDPTGVVVVSGPRAIVVGISAEEYQVIDITQEQTSPLPRCGGLEVNTGVNGIDTVLAASGRAYSYIITGDATTELKIIEGGPGDNGTDYYLTGTFLSQIFDATAIATGSSESAFNRISASVTQPSAGTTIALQFAAVDAVSGSCNSATFTFVGPDGTSNTSYTSTDGTTISGVLPFSDDGVGYENPGRCFRYRAAFITEDPTLTPILSDVSISLSP